MLTPCRRWPSACSPSSRPPSLRTGLESGSRGFDLAEGGRAIRVYRRSGAATITRPRPSRPSCFSPTVNLVTDTPGLLTIEPLEGPGALRWRARFRVLGRLQAGSLPGSVRQPSTCRALPISSSATRSTSICCRPGASFGGLVFSDLQLALDIEVMTTEGHEFPSAARPGDRIIAVALADSTGFRHVVRGDRLDERALLEECSRIVRERDPDEGHNIFRFDLEYLEARARLHGVALAWGRGGERLEPGGPATDRRAHHRVSALRGRRPTHHRHVDPGPAARRRDA